MFQDALNYQRLTVRIRLWWTYFQKCKLGVIYAQQYSIDIR